MQSSWPVYCSANEVLWQNTLCCLPLFDLTKWQFGDRYYCLSQMLSCVSFLLALKLHASMRVF